uniref:Receptor-like serine/threonine-protein kinase ALE2 isoform X3 n=1 Tax=Rhizophora mucronata TaxID=61149 RepID=A0A2P2LN44_RHIMU
MVPSLTHPLTHLLLVCLLTFAFNCLGHWVPDMQPFSALQPNQPLSVKEILVEHGRSVLNTVHFFQSQPAQWSVVKPFLGHSTASAPAVLYQGHTSGPIEAPVSRRHGHYRRHRHHHHHHHVQPVMVAPSPSEERSCDQICIDPLTASPFGSPCSCVFPMKVRLLLDVAPFAVFPVLNQLEIEIALGTYLEQSQVKIMGASADSQNQGKTVVDINLVPLGEKFDTTTAMLTCERLWYKKVPLNVTLFGNYEVLYVTYPGNNFNLFKSFAALRLCYFVVFMT